MNDDTRENLLFFDFDGTLSPIISVRAEAVIHPDCKSLLEELAAMPHVRVAVLSGRLLDDLVPRVGVPHVFLGGGSGVEWFVEGRNRWIIDEKMVERLNAARAQILPQLMELAMISEVDVEDKKWSVAIHTRKCPQESKKRVAASLKALNMSGTARIFKGPEVFEIQFLPEVDKSFGVRELCNVLAFDLSRGKLLYAGDDENDATAMLWVLDHGGIAVTVGRTPLVPGARVVEGPSALAREIRRLFGLAGKNIGD